MTLKTKIVNTVLLGILFFSLSIAFFYNNEIRQRDIKGVDEKLLQWVSYCELTLPPDYHDRVSDEFSVPKEEYHRLVERNNRRCREMGLQYLWSVLVLDLENIVFTTATSPSHDVGKGDHAEFFETHRDPGSYKTVIETMQPEFSSFHNEWGHGRMVLVPRMDSKGRIYIFGASVDINDLFVRQKVRIRTVAAIILVILAGGVMYSVFLANLLSRPIVRLSKVAREISQGNLDQRVEFKGARELEELAESVNRMSQTISLNIAKLREYGNDLQNLVDERGKELRLAHEKLARSEKFAALGQLAGIVGHELRNPLGVIRNAVYYLKIKLSDILKDEKVGKYFGIIEEEVDSADRIINDILIYGRIKEPKIGDVDVNALIDKNLSRTKVHAGITVEKKFQEGLPLIKADGSQLEHVFVNMFSNAASAMPGGGTLTVETTAVRDSVEIKFRDTGVGIAEKDLTRIFELGFSSKPHGTGTGLGLAICQSIVNLHNGKIKVSSELNKGTEFTVILPLDHKILK